MNKNNRRKLQVIATVLVIALCSLFVISYVGADAPVVSYAYPSNAQYYAFADTQEGAGANWTINVTDADTNLERVVLKDNSSGTWSIFYDSGSLGSVAYHNASDVNYNWTGSWTLYYWQICKEDGVGWYNETYTFTTAYQWGEPKMFVFNDTENHDFGGTCIIRNNTNDYHAFYYGRASGDYLMIKNSTTGTDWQLNAGYQLVDKNDAVPLNAFKYNNTYYCIFFDYTGTGTDDFYRLVHWNGTAYQFEDTNVRCYDFYSSGNTYYTVGCGGDIIYYNGVWNFVVAQPSSSSIQLKHFTGTLPDNWVELDTLETGLEHYAPAYSFTSCQPEVSLEILDGLLYCVYRDGGEDVHWQYYDGVDWTDGGDIYDDVEHHSIGTDYEIFPRVYQVGVQLGEAYRGCTMVKDMLNNQLVTIFVNKTGNGEPTDGALMYTVFNGTGWEGPHMIFAPASGAGISYPRAEFIDSRLVVSFSYYLRTENAIYTIAAPGYTKTKSGTNTVYNRIQFPDAAPSATNVNSTVFTLKNTDSRNITAIDWHFEDIGDITAASNFKIWTNMSGSWQGWTCDGSGDISEIDISVIKGAEWEKGQTTYWKLEILAIGGVAEDFHATDEDIYYKITLA